MVGEMGFRAALIAYLANHSTLLSIVNGVFEQASDRLTAPYIAIADSVSSDWSVKGRQGRELRIALAVHDEGDDAARLMQICALVEQHLSDMPTGQPGFDLVALQFLRARTRRGEDGRWQALLEYRARILMH